MVARPGPDSEPRRLPEAWDIFWRFADMVPPDLLRQAWSLIVVPVVRM